MKIVNRIVRRVALPMLIFIVLCVGTGIGFSNVPGGFLPDEDENQ